jgi:glucose/arabinose dehydrogenase
VEPKVPVGFHIETFAKGLKAPRLLRVAPNGDVFVAASDAGEIQVLRTEAGKLPVERVATFAKGLDEPFGIVFYPAGPSPEWVYVAEANVVRRYPYSNGDLVARGQSEVIVSQISPKAGGHTMRDLAFSNDGKRLFVAVGSASNVADDIFAISPEEIRVFESTHGVGAMWGYEEWRADVLAFDIDGKNRRTYATGLRNCSGLSVHPQTGDVWCAVNERDKLGDDLVPDYVTRVRENAFYGWPWYYLGDHEDPRLGSARKDLATKITVPDVLFQPHSAPLQIAFYDGAMFPEEYRGTLFVALHGSWNRESRTGYKVVRALMNDGVPTGEYEDFMTGMVVDDDGVWARPVGVAVAKDGALLVGEDGNGVIWRVTYR